MTISGENARTRMFLRIPKMADTLVRTLIWNGALKWLPHYYENYLENTASVWDKVLNYLCF